MVVSEQRVAPIARQECGYLLAHAFAPRPRETNYILSHVTPKRIGLRRPVDDIERGDVTVEVVFCPLMEGQHHLFSSRICLSDT